jgi:adenylate cyclase
LKQLKFSIGWLVPLVTIAAALIVYKLDPVPLQALRNAGFDQYQRWDDRTYRESPVRVIDIDDESIAKLGQWPWPRGRVAELLRRLQDAGAASISFDVLFAEPDRTSPAAMLDTWRPPPPLRALIAALPDHDALFAKQIAQGRVVLGHVLQNASEPPARFSYPFVVRTKGPSPLPYLQPHRGVIAALPDLQAAASGHGSFNFNSDSDGIVRKVPLILRMGDEIVPSLTAEALRVSVGAPMYLVTTSAEDGAGIESVTIGPHKVPTTHDGEMWVRFTHGWQARTIPAWKILSGEVPDEAIKGRILLIGTSAVGLMDLRFGPLGGAIPGVQAHAHALDQMTADDHLVQPNWAPALEMALIVVGGLLVGFIALSTSALLSAAVVAAVLVAAGWTGWYVYSHHGLLVDPATPGLALILTFVNSSLYHHIVSERRQRWVKQAFARYVSPNLVAHLVDNPGTLQLGGIRRECSFIFTDLAGFTTLMEKLDPTEAVSLLNQYLDNMIHIAFEHGGTLDRIVGDAVALMFSAPVEQPDHRQRAVRCAEALYRFASRFAADAQARGVPFGVTRIGIHTGEVTVGNFGGSTIFDYRALGDPVNTAARLETVNKYLGTLVCISEATLSGTQDVPARPVGKLVLKGKSLTLLVYEPQFSVNIEDCAPQAEYAAAYALLASNDPAAEEAFAELALRWPRDALLKLHLKRLRSGESGDTIADRRGLVIRLQPVSGKPSSSESAGVVPETTAGNA